MNTLLRFVNEIVGRPMPSSAIILRRHDAVKVLRRVQTGVRAEIEPEAVALLADHARRNDLIARLIEAAAVLDPILLSLTSIVLYPADNLRTVHANVVRAVYRDFGRRQEPSTTIQVEHTNVLEMAPHMVSALRERADVLYQHSSSSELRLHQRLLARTRQREAINLASIERSIT